jgi:hypothetical protein
MPGAHFSNSVLHAAGPETFEGPGQMEHCYDRASKTRRRANGPVGDDTGNGPMRRAFYLAVLRAVLMALPSRTTASASGGTLAEPSRFAPFVGTWQKHCMTLSVAEDGSAQALMSPSAACLLPGRRCLAAVYRVA